MTLIVSSDATQMRCAAGEPIAFSYTPATASGVPEDLANRTFVFSIHDDDRNSKGFYNGTLDSGVYPCFEWGLDGAVSEELFGQTPLNWEIAERLDGTDRDIVRTGKLMIDVSAPFPSGSDTGTRSRYISRITRLNDPDTLDAPKFRVNLMARDQSIVVTPPDPVEGTNSTMDFQNPYNSFLVGVL